MLTPTSGKWESTGVCKYIGLQPPDRPSRASNSTLQMHIVWVTYQQLAFRFSYLPTFLLFISRKVYTSAYDCTVRSLSFTSGISREVYAMEDAVITSMDIPPASHEMWLSDAEGWATHLDLREDKSKRRAYQLSDQKIGCLSVNPTNPAFILTSSNNRTLKYAILFFLAPFHAPRLRGSTLISLCDCDQGLGCTETSKASGASIAALFHWSSSHSSEQVPRNGVLELELQDVEQLDKPKGGTATLRADCKHDKAVTSAYWDPRGRSIVSTCYDDSLRCMYCMIACVVVFPVLTLLSS